MAKHANWPVDQAETVSYIVNAVSFAATPCVRRGGKEEAWIAQLTTNLIGVDRRLELPSPPKGMRKYRRRELERLVITALCGRRAQHASDFGWIARANLIVRGTRLGLRHLCTHVRGYGAQDALSYKTHCGDVLALASCDLPEQTPVVPKLRSRRSVSLAS